MLQRKTEKHYGVLVFSLAFIILFQSMAIGRDASRLEMPALTILMPFDEQPAAQKAAAAAGGPEARSTATATHELQLAEQMASQGLFVEPSELPIVADLTYTMQAGDTFYGVAERFGLTPGELAAANGLARHWVPAGTELRVPRSEAAGTTLAAAQQMDGEYSVRKGDTLASIAQRFRMSANDLLTANGLLTGQKPEEGHRLLVRIPRTADYKIRAGDSLWQLSRDFDVEVTKIIEINGLDGATLIAGATLQIPVADVGTLDAVWKRNRGDDSRFRMPLRGGRLTDRFGPRIHPIYRVKNYHSGQDIAAPRGTIIRSARDGVVRFAGYRRGYGRLVVVRHPDGMESWYGHCSQLLTQTGARVGSGDKLAKVGSSGLATGPHLHFEIRKNKKPVDPLKYLRG